VIGLIAHDSSLRHTNPPGHVERVERIETVAKHLFDSGLADRLDSFEPDPAPRELVELVHTPEHVDRLVALDSGGGGRIDSDTSMSTHSLEAALRSCQGSVDAVGRVLDGRWSGALVCMRPPGHHATRRQAMGFCLFNQIACAARWAVTSGRARRVVILDWDVHHGNGTQDIFWSDPSVLYMSLHQYPWYPGTGDATERGEGEGEGTTLNVPLPAGSAEDVYDRAFNEVIEPAVSSFGPDLVMVSAGFDAHHADPLASMRLSAGAFYRFTRRVATWGRGPVCVLEGGYDLEGLAWSVGATVSGLLGLDEPVGVPWAELGPLLGAPEAHQWLDRVVALLDS
jgi:acetoin utilization deacetylase AcuC-like enzyme